VFGGEAVYAAEFAELVPQPLSLFRYHCAPCSSICEIGYDLLRYSLAYDAHL
jgi:hypothetical protein